ncbi:hypothetical protein D3C78_1521260 [compost metagenome]
MIDLAVGPVLLALRHAGTDNADQRRRLGNFRSVVFVRRPIGPQGQGNTVAVLPVHENVFVHQQVHQRQCLGEEHDDQHQPEGAGEETLGEPNGGFHE